MTPSDGPERGRTDRRLRGVPHNMAVGWRQHWFPRSQLHVFGRCGRWTQIEHQARFNRLVDDFLWKPTRLPPDGICFGELHG